MSTPEKADSTTRRRRISVRPVRKDDDWRRELTPEEYRVLRQAGTERPYTGEYWDTHTAGVYHCRACGAELFTSNEKFDSHCGWPSFWAPLAEERVRYIHDRTLGMERIEVRCSNVTRTWATSLRARATARPLTSGTASTRFR